MNESKRKDLIGALNYLHALAKLAPVPMTEHANGMEAYRKIAGYVEEVYLDRVAREELQVHKPTGKTLKTKK